MKIASGADHGGYAVKQDLVALRTQATHEVLLDGIPAVVGAADRIEDVLVGGSVQPVLRGELALED